MVREWLRIVREKKGLTQDTVAEKSCISRSYYTRIENGNYSIPIHTAKKIALVLGFEYTQFYDAL